MTTLFRKLGIAFKIIFVKTTINKDDILNVVALIFVKSRVSKLTKFMKDALGIGNKIRFGHSLVF